jgi:hypothetical protein
VQVDLGAGAVPRRGEPYPSEQLHRRRLCAARRSADRSAEECRASPPAPRTRYRHSEQTASSPSGIQTRSPQQNIK